MEGDKRTFRVNFTHEGVLRLRAVVNEKLKEIMGDYTDDTLVEYVIVLLKNGRSKDEAKSELNVFLGDDSDSFVSWLWDHLGSTISLYVQPKELRPDGSPQMKPTAGDEAEKTETNQIEPEAGKGNSVLEHGHRNNRQSKGSLRGGDENEAPLRRNSDADTGISQDEPHHRVGRRNIFLSPRPTIQKRRMQTEDRQPRKREVSHSAASAPRRLLQFAVRDALAASRPPNATAEPSRKRLRSVVSTKTDDLLQEEFPQRIRHTCMDAAIKAAAEAVEDVTRLGPSRNVFNRLGHASNVSKTTYYQEHGHVTGDLGDRNFGTEVENFHSAYHPQNDDITLQEGNISPFHDTILDSVLRYDGEDYDDIDERGRDATDVSWLGTSDRIQYEAGANNDDRPYRPSKILGPPAMGNTVSLRIASSVSMNTRKPQYQEERDVSEMDNCRRALTSAVVTESDDWLMKESNNPKLAFTGNTKPDTIQQHEKTQTPTVHAGLQSTAASIEDADSRTIFISNVHYAATKDSLSLHFNKFGDVLKVLILTDPATGQPKGSAYIEFMRKEAAERALSLDGTSFMSRLLKIVRKSSHQPEIASITAWPRTFRASLFPVLRFGRVPFARGVPNIYRARGPTIPGARSYQWKRGADSTATETSAHSSNSTYPTVRGLTYIRAETNTNGSSGAA